MGTIQEPNVTLTIILHILLAVFFGRKNLVDSSNKSLSFQERERIWDFVTKREVYSKFYRLNHHLKLPKENMIYHITLIILLTGSKANLPNALFTAYVQE